MYIYVYIHCIYMYIYIHTNVRGLYARVVHVQSDRKYEVLTDVYVLLTLLWFEEWLQPYLLHLFVDTLKNLPFDSALMYMYN